MRYKINNWPVGNIYLLIQFAILFLLLYNQEKSKILAAIFSLCIAISLLDFLVFHGPMVFNSYAAYANGISMIVLSLRFQQRLMKDIRVEKIQNLPLLWLSFGILAYYGGTVFLFLFNNYLIRYFPHSYSSIWVMHNVLNILKNVFLFVCVWKIFKSPKSAS